MSITDVVCNTKDISNEKIKQNKVLQPDGTSFAGIENLKSWTDQTDKYLIYKITINEEYVFKTSKQKLLLENDMILVRVTIRITSFVTLKEKSEESKIL